MAEQRQVDLRSDTVTQPPPGMRAAIATAQLGDDVYGEDPTVNRLEGLAADMFGMPAALLVASGTMGNLLAMMAHCARGRKVLVGDRSDAWLWEANGGSVLAGLAYKPVATSPNGELKIRDLETAVDTDDDPQCSVTGLLCLENTHGMCGGTVLSLEYLARARAFVRRHHIPLHLDGARIFNAAAALHVAPRDIAAFADTVTFCLSKGLAAPIGSVLVGQQDVIRQARRLRKMLGGGMRQAGVIAAAGVYALENMIDRLKDDHATAAQLAGSLRRLPGITLDSASPATNIVFWDFSNPALSTDAFIDALKDRGVRVMQFGGGRIRAITHCGITSDDVIYASEAIASAYEQVQTVSRRHRAV